MCPECARVAAFLRQQDAEHREALASAMNDCSLATGHGDTHADLLVEMVGEVLELIQKWKGERTRVLEEVKTRLYEARGYGTESAISFEQFIEYDIDPMLAALKASSGEEEPHA